MSSTYAALQASKYHKLAFAIVIEGLPVGITTAGSADLPLIAAAWNDTDWQYTSDGGKDPQGSTTTTWYMGAFLPGEIREEIDLLDPRVQGTSMSFTVQDPRDRLAALCFAHASSTAYTFLTSDLVANNNGAIVVLDTSSFSGFAGTYQIYVGNETIEVTSAARTATGWSSSVRGRYQLHGTDHSQRFGRAHRKNTVTQYKPIVSSSPASVLGRICHIYLHHWDGITWSTQDDALPYWSGRIAEVKDNGDRTLSFTLDHLVETLNVQLLSDQFVADLDERFYVTDAMSRLKVREYVYGRIGNTVSFTLSTVSAFQTVDGLIKEINAKLIESVSGLSFGWSMLRTGEGTAQVRMTTSGLTEIWPANNSVEFSLFMDARLANILGFEIPPDAIKESGTGHQYKIVPLNLRPENSSGTMGYYTSTARYGPLRYTYVPGVNESFFIPVTNARGTYGAQPVITTMEGKLSTAAAYFMVGDIAILQGYYDSGSSQIVVTEDATKFFAGLGFNASGGDTPFASQAIRRGQNDTPLTIKQIWYERAPMRDILFRLLLSTGNPGFGHDTWDVNPIGMSVGVPYERLDFAKFLELPGGDVFSLLLTEPTEFTRILVSILAGTKRHIVLRQGLLSLAEAQITGPLVAGAYVLTEDNKASPEDRPRPSISAAGVVNRLEISYDKDIGGTYHGKLLVEDTTSSSDIFQPQTKTIELDGLAPGGDGLAQIVSSLSAHILGLFARPLTYFERTITKQAMHLSPGDTVVISDDYLMHPVNGTRGVTTWPCLVKGKSFDPETMSGVLMLGTSGDMRADKICPLAPTARVDNTASNAGYVVVDGSTRYLAVLPYQYDNSADGVVTTLFTAGDKLIVRELSPVDPFVPLVFHVTVNSLDLSLSVPKIYLTATITGWDTTKKYIVTPDVIGTVVASQRSATFVADDADNSVGIASNDAYLWGSARPYATSTAATLTQQFVTPPRTYVDTEGYPVASGDYYELVQSLNVLLSYGTRHMGMTPTWARSALAATTDTTRTLLFGPVWMPCYGWGARSFLGHLRIKSTASATATYYITTSRQFPVGTGYSTVAFIDGFAQTTTVTTTSSTFVWSSEFTLVATPNPALLPPGVWVTIEAQVGSGIAHLDGVSITEDSL